MRLAAFNLAYTYKTSATPVREALARLMADGIIVQHRNRGFYSKPFTVLEQRELHLTSLALVSGALRATLKAGEAAWRGHLEIKPLANAADRLATQLETMGMAFVDAAENSVLGAFSRLTLDRTRLVRRLDLRSPEAHAKTKRNMSLVLSAAEAGDAAQAEAALSNLIHDRIERLDMLVDEANALAASVHDPWEAYR